MSQESGSPSRAKILDVAEALFARRGYAGVGLREVAAGVGLGKSSLFHHFPTKVELYNDVLARVLDRLEARLEPALERPVGHAERLDRWIDALIDALAENPQSARLALRSLFEEALDDCAAPAYAGTLTRLVENFQQLLSEGIEAGTFRSVSVGHLTQTIIGATVYHFASAEFGEEVTGASLFSAAQVDARKREIKQLLRAGILKPADASCAAAESHEEHEERT